MEIFRKETVNVVSCLLKVVNATHSLQKEANSLFLLNEIANVLKRWQQTATLHLLVITGNFKTFLRFSLLKRPFTKTLHQRCFTEEISPLSLQRESIKEVTLLTNLDLDCT